MGLLYNQRSKVRSKTGITDPGVQFSDGSLPHPQQIRPLGGWIPWFFLFWERGERSGSLLAGLGLLRVRFPDQEERGSEGGGQEVDEGETREK